MKVLIIDDEKYIRESIQRILELEKIDSVTAANGEQGMDLLLDNNFDAVILDLRLPGMNGQELMEWMVEQSIRTPIIMISAHGEIQDAVAALKTGAKDYLEKPFEPAELLLKLKYIVENAHRENLIELGRRTNREESDLIGNSPVMVSIRKQLHKIATTNATVLITGESGTGKEVIAREIHALSPYREEPFVAVNVGGIPDTLIESELFGHEKGAFTGAEAMKPGLFELAGKGSIFLDEIGEMPAPLQVKLLRVLQERKTRRLGGIRDMNTEARVLAATNREIEEQVEKGLFREDLFYRLNVVRISAPPLRDRKEDIPLLAGFLLQKVSRKMGHSDVTLHPKALEKLMYYDYPGNIRELENLLERALIYREGVEILPGDIEIRTDFSAPDTGKTPVSPATGTGSLAHLEREAIIRALAKWEGNRTKAAEELGISRRTIIYKIKQFGLDQE